MHFDAVLIEPRRAAMKAAGFWLGKTPDDYFDANLAANPNAKALSAYTAAAAAGNETPADTSAVSSAIPRARFIRRPQRVGRSCRTAAYRA